MEVPVSTVFVPPDSAAAQYQFKAGLRSRIPAKMPFPSVWEPSTGKLGGLDYTILVDAKVTPDEMLAILKYTLDQHLNGNHSPFIFCGHTFLYSFSTPGDNGDTPDMRTRDARWAALSAFINYAHSKREVRMRPVRDVVAWMQNPVALSGATGATPDAGAADQPDADANDDSGTPGGGGTGGGSVDAGSQGTGGSGGSGGTGGSAGAGGGGAGVGGGVGGKSGGGAGQTGAGGDGGTGDAGGSGPPRKSGGSTGCHMAGSSTAQPRCMVALLVGLMIFRGRRRRI
jgi:hypothetical protein